MINEDLIDLSQTLDPNTTAWLHRDIKGIQHSVNRCNAEYVGVWESVRELRKQTAEQDVAIEDIRATIGELKHTIEKAREAFKALREPKGGE